MQIYSFCACVQIYTCAHQLNSNFRNLGVIINLGARAEFRAIKTKYDFFPVTEGCLLLGLNVSPLRTEAVVPVCQMLEVGQCTVTQWLQRIHHACTCTNIQREGRQRRARVHIQFKPHFKDIFKHKATRLATQNDELIK